MNYTFSINSQIYLYQHSLSSQQPNIQYMGYQLWIIHSVSTVKYIFINIHSIVSSQIYSIWAINYELYIQYQQSNISLLSTFTQQSAAKYTVYGLSTMNYTFSINSQIYLCYQHSLNSQQPNIQCMDYQLWIIHSVSTVKYIFVINIQ